MVNKKHPTFSTSNTALAAYLASEGFELADKTISDSQEVVFIFANNSKELKALIHAFDMGTAQGNIALFYYNYRKLVGLARRELKLYGKEK